MNTRHEWIRELEKVSPTVASMRLTDSLVDEPYWDSVAARPLNEHGFNFSHSPEHNAFLGATIDGLSAQLATPSQLRKLVTDLTSRSTYGTFSELAAYGALIRHGVPFRIQIPLAAADILNPNGSELDGEIEGGILFDVKAFGLQENLIDSLVEQLKQDLAPDFVSAESNWNVAVKFVEGLLRSANYTALREELRAKRRAKRGTIEFCARAASNVQTSIRTVEPRGLAEQNADYAFSYSKQFARLKPFILVFVLHPWLGGFSLSTNFSGYGDDFMQEFARKTFTQFLSDETNLHFGVTRADVSKMLSGLLFIDAWQGTNPPTRDTMRLYLNSHADRPVFAHVLSMLRHQVRQLHVELI